VSRIAAVVAELVEEAVVGRCERIHRLRCWRVVVRCTEEGVLLLRRVGWA
jgi:hypothetical protein